MSNKIIETIIIGAGISGLSCGRRLNQFNKEFLIVSIDIGGRILTSKDGSVNYGAFFVCSDYKNILKFVKLKNRIKLSDFFFHDKDKSFFLFEPKMIFYIYQFIKLLKIQYKFRKELRKLRLECETKSQKNVIQKNQYLKKLYMKDATDFIKENKIKEITKLYLSKALYSTTFSDISEMNAFSFLQFLLPLITPIYTFTFQKDKMIESFKNKIIIDRIDEIKYKNNIYELKSDKNIYHCKNLVLATPITFSKKFSNIKKVNKPIDTNMLHIKGNLKKIYKKKKYHLFYPYNEIQAIADLNDGTYLTYYRKKITNLDKYFVDYDIIFGHNWSPAGTINGHFLIESNRGNNMYIIGDYNIAGLEETYLTGIFAANNIIRSK